MRKKIKIMIDDVLRQIPDLESSPSENKQATSFPTDTFTFDDIRRELLVFCGNHSKKSYKVTWNFANLVRICQGKQGKKLAEFKPAYCLYFHDPLKQDILKYFQDTQYLKYFTGELKLQEVQ